MSGAWWLPPDLGRRPLACGNTGRGDRVLTCGLFVPNGEPLFAAVPLSTRGGVLSTNAVRQVRPVRPGTPGFAPFLLPGRHSPPHGIGRMRGTGSKPFAGVNEDASLSHECPSVGLGDETWGVVHVVLGRQDSSQLGWQGVVGQVDSVQQSRRVVVVLAPAVATQSQAADGIGGGDRGEHCQGCGHVGVRLGGWLAQDHLCDVDECLGLFATSACFGGGAGSDS